MYPRASSYSQNPKLRASCDTCFLAKVRCSKTRPLCSRCLVFGSDCKYSPSSRAGKPKPDGKGSRPSRSQDSPISGVPPSINYQLPLMNIDTEDPTTYFLGTDWPTTPTPELGGQENRCLIPSPVIPITGDQSGSEARSPQGNADLQDPVLYWANIPPTDITSPYIDNLLQLQPESMADDSDPPPVALWFDQTDSIHFSNSGPSAPQSSPLINIFLDECLARTATCNCFNTCLQALHTLCNFSAVPPASSFDIVLTINQKAMETCSTTLNCPICNSQTDSSLRTMLLGTILQRIILIYQDTSKNYFRPTSGSGNQLQLLPLTFGIYRVASEDNRWLQLVIILRDLKKFKGLLTKFQETLMESESRKDVEMHSAVTHHLYQSLHLTCEALKEHKNAAWGQIG